MNNNNNMVALRGDHLLKCNQMKKKKSIGLGDTVHKVTKALGIKKVVDKVSKATGKDCGCGKRQETLNRFFPYNK